MQSYTVVEGASQQFGKQWKVLYTKAYIGRSLMIGTVISVFFTYYYYSSAVLHLVEVPSYYDKIQHSFTNTGWGHKSLNDGYIVWSPSCSIPNISANHESIQKFVYKKKHISCSFKEPLTELVFNNSSNDYTITIIENHIKLYMKSKHWLYRPRCCYSLITRKYAAHHTKQHIDDEMNIEMSECFEKSIAVPSNAEFIYVNCYKVRKSNGHRVDTKDIFKDMYVVLVVKEDINKLKTRSQILKLSYKENSLIADNKAALLFSNVTNSTEENVTKTSIINSTEISTVKKTPTINSIEISTVTKMPTINRTEISTVTVEKVGNTGVNSSLIIKEITSINNDNDGRMIEDDENNSSADDSDGFTSDILGKNNFSSITTNEEINSPSILVIGIDSVSRLNQIRSMPKTTEFLIHDGWHTLEGYTKVAENTFPNLIPILTGLSDHQLRSSCYRNQLSEIDNCTFIWEEFKKKGYITAYVEDEPKLSTFNYNKYGFLKQPTDYYIRPFLLAAEKLLHVKEFDGLKYCLGSRSAAEYILKYCEDFVSTFEKKPYFGFFWMNSFSHNDVNDVSSMDVEVEKFLQRIVKHLDSTIVIFLSDHGTRWGAIRQTFVGWLEERMPFLYFRIPRSFKKRYPNKYRNLLRNKNRLTSPFDLHLTLQDILNDSETTKHLAAEGCLECESLFTLASWNRSCSQAGIPYHWCTCGSEYDSISYDNNKAISSAANFIIQTLNDMIVKKNKEKVPSAGTKCASLELKRVLSVRQKTGKKATTSTEYIIVLEATPSGALYETSILHSGSTFTILDSIERINTYGYQSNCVSDTSFKKYCFCVKSK